MRNVSRDTKIWKKKYDEAQRRLAVLKSAGVSLDRLEEENAKLKSDLGSSRSTRAVQTRKIKQLEGEVAEGLALSGQRADALRQAEVENTTLREQLGALTEERAAWREEQQRVAAEVERLAIRVGEQTEEIGCLNARVQVAEYSAAALANLKQFEKSIRRDVVKSVRGQRPWDKTILRFFTFFGLESYAPGFNETPAAPATHLAEVRAAEAAMFEDLASDAVSPEG